MRENDYVPLPSLFLPPRLTAGQSGAARGASKTANICPQLSRPRRLCSATPLQTRIGPGESGRTPDGVAVNPGSVRLGS